MPSKRCSSCREILPLDKFGLLSTSQDGYSHSCLSCRRDISRLSRLRKAEGLCQKKNLPRTSSLVSKNRFALQSFYDADERSISVIPVDFRSEAFKFQITCQENRFSLMGPSEDLIVCLEFGSKANFQEAIAFMAVWLSERNLEVIELDGKM